MIATPLRALGRRLSPSVATAATSSRSAAVAQLRFSSSSTTYSGGHPYEGQGGFYGSIKSRSDLAAEFIPGSRVEAQDLQLLVELMNKWAVQKEALKSPDEQAAAWEALTHEQATVELVKRLIVKGGPAWGLSVQQREFVKGFHPV
ncbi:hypothetical protein Gpo141_00005392 [Globisporangium polare]